MSRARSIAAVVALLAVGGATAATAPTDAEVVADFPTHGGVGETVDSRMLSARVHDVAVTRTIVRTDFAGTGDTVTTPGRWVVVDTTVVAHDDTATLSTSRLRLGDRTFRLSAVLPAGSLVDLPLGVGVPTRGLLLFEVSAEALDAVDRMDIEFSPSSSLGLDGLPIVTVPVPDVEDSRIEMVGPVAEGTS